MIKKKKVCQTLVFHVVGFICYNLHFSTNFPFILVLFAFLGHILCLNVLECSHNNTTSILIWPRFPISIYKEGLKATFCPFFLIVVFLFLFVLSLVDLCNRPFLTH